MPEQGNKKIYIGDVVVNEDNEKYQKQFFEDIIKTFFGHGNGLDADTVDGYHAYCFATAEQGKKADNALQSPLLVGTETELRNVTETGYQWIFDEGIKVNNDFIQEILKFFGDDIEQIPDYFSGNTKDDLTEDRGTGFKSNLAIILPGIWRILQKQLENKVDKRPGYDLSQNDFTNEYKEKIDTFGSKIKTIECEEGIQKQILDADMVNGLQFILITQEQYDALSDKQKNNWQNVYILVDETPTGYESPALCTFKSGYLFEVRDCQLYYKPIQAKEWSVMYDFEALQTLFHCHVMRSLEGDEAPSFTDNEYLNYPFISSNLISKFVNTIDCEGTYGTENINIDFPQSTDSTSMLTKINIFPLYNAFMGKIENLKEQINNLMESFNTFKGEISTEFSNFKNTIANDLKTFKQEVSSTYVTKTDFNEKYNSLLANINVVKKQLNDLNNDFDKKTKKVIEAEDKKHTLVFNIPLDSVSGEPNTYRVHQYNTGNGYVGTLPLRITDGNNEVDSAMGHAIEKHYALVCLNGVWYRQKLVYQIDSRHYGFNINVKLDPGTYEHCCIIVPGFDGEWRWFRTQSEFFNLKVTRN